MPHFIIHCSAQVLKMESEQILLREVFTLAKDSGLFAPKDIKVRLQTFETFLNGEENGDFLHIFANIMEGRTDEQKSALSRAMVSRLKTILPDVPVISMNIRDFLRAGYCNRGMV